MRFHRALLAVLNVVSALLAVQFLVVEQLHQLGVPAQWISALVAAVGLAGNVAAVLLHAQAMAADSLSSSAPAASPAGAPLPTFPPPPAPPAPAPTTPQPWQIAPTPPSGGAS